MKVVEDSETESGMIVEKVLLPSLKDGLTRLVITNLSWLTRTIPLGTFLETLQEFDHLSADVKSGDAGEHVSGVKKQPSFREARRKKTLLDELKLDEVPDAEVPQLHEFLMQNHMVCSLRPSERGDGETDIVTISVDMGATKPH